MCNQPCNCKQKSRKEISHLNSRSKNSIIKNSDGDDLLDIENRFLYYYNTIRYLLKQKTRDSRELKKIYSELVNISPSYNLYEN